MVRVQLELQFHVMLKTDLEELCKPQNPWSSVEHSSSRGDDVLDTLTGVSLGNIKG